MLIAWQNMYTRGLLDYPSSILFIIRGAIQRNMGVSSTCVLVVWYQVKIIHWTRWFSQPKTVAFEQQLILVPGPWPITLVLLHLWRVIAWINSWQWCKAPASWKSFRPSLGNVKSAEPNQAPLVPLKAQNQVLVSQLHRHCVRFYIDDEIIRYLAFSFLLHLK